MGVEAKKSFQLNLKEFLQKYSRIREKIVEERLLELGVLQLQGVSYSCRPRFSHSTSGSLFLPLSRWWKDHDQSN
ncbi:MAG: hypothetical protein ACFFC6_17050 [Promethearchaeota archaeon]